MNDQYVGLRAYHTVVRLIRTLQLRLDRDDIILLIYLNHPVNLRRIAHQLDSARIHHALIRVAVLGEVVEHNVRNRRTAGSLMPESYVRSISNVWVI